MCNTLLKIVLNELVFDVDIKIDSCVAQAELVNRLTAAKKLYAYISHVYFVNFER